jgi:hypothetical protein
MQQQVSALKLRIYVKSNCDASNLALNEIKQLGIKVRIIKNSGAVFNLLPNKSVIYFPVYYSLVTKKVIEGYKPITEVIELLR